MFSLQPFVEKKDKLAYLSRNFVSKYGKIMIFFLAINHFLLKKSIFFMVNVFSFIFRAFL